MAVATRSTLAWSPVCIGTLMADSTPGSAARYGAAGTRTSVLRYPNGAAANWHPVPIKGIVGYRCPICSTQLDGYNDDGPTTDTRTGMVVAPKQRTFKPCWCVVVMDDV